MALFPRFSRPARMPHSGRGAAAVKMDGREICRCSGGAHSSGCRGKRAGMWIWRGWGVNVGGRWCFLVCEREIKGVGLVWIDWNFLGIIISNDCCSSVKFLWIMCDRNHNFLTMSILMVGSTLTLDLWGQLYCVHVLFYYHYKNKWGGMDAPQL